MNHGAVHRLYRRRTYSKGNTGTLASEESDLDARNNVSELVNVTVLYVPQHSYRGVGQWYQDGSGAKAHRNFPTSKRS